MLNEMPRVVHVRPRRAVFLNEIYCLVCIYQPFCIATFCSCSFCRFHWVRVPMEIEICFPIYNKTARYSLKEPRDYLFNLYSKHVYTGYVWCRSTCNIWLQSHSFAM